MWSPDTGIYNKPQQYSGQYNESFDTQTDYYPAKAQSNNKQNQKDYEVFPKYGNDPNDPANIPYMAPYVEDDQYEEYVVKFIRGINQYTPHYEEIGFAKYIGECSILDKKIRVLQQLIMNDPRFSCRMLFDFFDCKKSNSLDFNEFQLGLQKLDIVVSQQECYQLFQRYGGLDDQRISSAEFKYMLLGPDDGGEFLRFGAQKYMRHGSKQQIQQFLSVAQRDTLYEILQNQVQLERNLNLIREVIGYDDILLALFRQLDVGQKGYITILDLTQYMNELGGEFFDRDLIQCFNRISKLNCSRINFNEFQQEFKFQAKEERRKFRQIDYLEELNKKRQLEKQQKPVEPPKIVQKQVPQKIEQGLYVQREQKNNTTKKQEKVNEEDLNDLLFPGFEKYEFI
ncbi:hypothetical protein pb186bvf_009640 [Paramecium bursaria]